MWQCLLTASTLVFEEFIREAKRRHNEDQEMESQLEYHAQYLLVQFNNQIREIRQVADKFLADLIDDFPFLLWSGKFISTALQLMQSLIENIDTDPDCKTSTFPVSNLPWQIHLQDSIEGRKAVAKDFTKRCEGILCVAVKWAPGFTNSYLLEYIRRTDSVNDRSLRLTIATVLSCTERDGLDTGSLLNVSSGSMNALGGGSLGFAESISIGGTSTNDESGSATDISAYLSVLSQRSDYLGQVKGMLSMLKETNNSSEMAEQALIDHLERMLESACEANDEDKFLKSIFLMSAFFIYTKELNHRLLHTLTWAPLKRFTEFTMRLCVTCWNWILVARENVQLDFLQEMTSCWTTIAQRGLGLFSRDQTLDCPLSVECCLKRPSPYIRPHAIWINFLMERISLARYCKQENVDLFEMMFLQTLSNNIGDSVVNQSLYNQHTPGDGHNLKTSSPLITRSIEAVGVRFRLLSSVLSMIQGDGICRTSTNVLRQRIYSVAFDYFTLPPQTPTQEGARLKQELFAYFERNFIRRPNGNDAIYAASLWNMCERAITGLPRTNNGVENWNGGFNGYFRRDSPPLADVVLKLQTDEEKTRQNMEIRARNPVPRAIGGIRSQKANFSGRQIQQLTRNYANGNGLPRLEFLVSISAHLEKYEGQ